jgi:hypothetical protein
MEKKAILLGPFVGEMYWEAGRFAPMLSYFEFKKYKGQNLTYIILTRSERFDLYGRYADILVPLKIDGDYETRQPNCFRLNGYSDAEYQKVAKNFYAQYSKRYKILEHVYPNISKAKYSNKNQYPQKHMLYKYKPREENYELINKHIPNSKPLILLAPRFRKGFKRNWPNWNKFYDLIYNDEKLMDSFHFIICGKEGEYIPDEKNRFHDMAKIGVGEKSSLIGLLLVLMEKTIFVCGSQSAIPNIALLYNREVLEFGCQKSLHTRTYNVKNAPITFIDDRRYNLDPQILYKKIVKLTEKHKENKNGK